MWIIGPGCHRPPFVHLLVSSTRLKCNIISSKCLIDEHYLVRGNLFYTYSRDSQEPKWCIVLLAMFPNFSPPHPGHRVPHVESLIGKAEDKKEIFGQSDYSQVSPIQPAIPCGRWSNPMPRICRGCLCPSRSSHFRQCRHSKLTFRTCVFQRPYALCFLTVMESKYQIAHRLAQFVLSRN